MTFGSEEKAKQAQQQQAGQQQTADAEKREIPWQIPHHREWPRTGQQVEFYSRFGERFLGIAVSVSSLTRDKGYGMPRQPDEILLMSENTDHPEYFSMHSVEKWRETNEVVPKKRFLGMVMPEQLQHLGELSPLFFMYTMLRLEQRLNARGFDSWYPDRYLTRHFSNEDRVEQWETEILFEDRMVTLIEVMGGEAISVKFGNRETKEYPFQRVSVAAEDICRFLQKDEDGHH